MIKFSYTIKILKLKKEDYSKIALLVNEADKIYFSIYSEEELKYIRICHESVENLIKSEKTRKYLRKGLWFNSY